jgi:hypothetical protein
MSGSVAVTRSDGRRRARLVRLRPGDAAGWLGEHRWAVALAVLALVAGVALRWWILAGPLGGPDLDEATVGIQARQFNDGHLSAFFLNQAYGGTVETGLVALSLRLFGSNVVALKAVPMALALVAAVLSRSLAVELRLSRTAQWAVPVIVWCGPAYAVLFSTKERGFYGVALVVAAACPLLVLRLADRPSARDAVLLGACVGLGWWQSPLTFLVAVPAVLWLVCARPRVIRLLLLAIPAALVAMAPWLLWNVRNGWGSVHAASGFGTSWGDRVFDWMLRLQVVLGLETPFDHSRRLVGFRWAGLVALTVILAVATVRTRRQAPWFLAVLVIGYGLLYGVNTLVAGVGEDPRYTYLMVPVVAVCIGAVLPDPPRDAQRFVVVVLVGALAVTSTAWGLVGSREAAVRPRPNPFLASPGIDEVAELLEARGVDGFISDFAGMQVAFLTDERVVGASFAVPRDAEYEVIGRAHDPSVYVLDEELLPNVARLRRWLDDNGVGYTEQRVGKWTVLFLDQRVLPGEAGLEVFGRLLGAQPGP